MEKIAIVLYLIVLGSLIPQGNAFGPIDKNEDRRTILDGKIVSYDCSINSKSKISAVAMNEVEECKTPKITFEETIERFGQVIQRKEFSQVNYITCSVSVEIIVTHCGMHHHISFVQNGWDEKIISLSKETCIDIHRTKMYKITKSTFDDLKINSINVRTAQLAGTIDKDGHCNGEFYSDKINSWSNVVVIAKYRIKLTTGTGKLRRKEDKVIIPVHNLNCPNNEDNVCHDDLVGTVFWTENQTSECGMYGTDVIFTGPILMSNFTDETNVKTPVATIKTRSHQFALKILRATRFCGVSVYATEHSRIYIAINVKGDRSVPFNSKDQILKENVDLQAYINAKFLFVTTSIHMSQSTMFKSLVEYSCLNKKMVLENRIALAKIDPSHVGNLIGKERGVYGHVRGEVLYLIKCEPKMVKLRNTQKCYNEIPVWKNDTKMFLTPITRILVPTGEEISCLPSLPVLHKLGDAWYGRIPEVISSPTPQKLDPNENAPSWLDKPLLEIGHLGLYTQNDMLRFQEALMFPNLRNAFQTEITRRGTVGNTWDMSKIMDEEEVLSFSDRLSTYMSPFATFYSLGGGMLAMTVFVIICLKIAVSVCSNCYTLYKNPERQKLSFPFNIIIFFAGLVDAITHMITTLLTTSDGNNEKKNMKLSKKIAKDEPYGVHIFTSETRTDNEEDVGIENNPVNQGEENSMNYPQLQVA